MRPTRILFDHPVAIVGRGHEAGVVVRQDRLGVLVGDADHQLLDAVGQRGVEVLRHRDRVVGQGIGGPHDLGRASLQPAALDHGVAVAVEVRRAVDLTAGHRDLVGGVRGAVRVAEVLLGLDATALEPRRRDEPARRGADVGE
jgi:hypothetical protein